MVLALGLSGVSSGLGLDLTEGHVLASGADLTSGDDGPGNDISRKRRRRGDLDSRHVVFVIIDLHHMRRTATINRAAPGLDAQALEFGADIGRGLTLDDSMIALVGGLALEAARRCLTVDAAVGWLTVDAAVGRLTVDAAVGCLAGTDGQSLHFVLILILRLLVHIDSVFNALSLWFGSAPIEHSLLQRRLGRDLLWRHNGR